MIQAHRVIIAPPAESRGLFSRLQGTTGHRTPLEPRGRALGGKDGRQLASQARGLSPRPEARAKALLPAGPGLSRAKGVTDDAGDGLSLGPAAPVPVSLSPRGLGLPAPHHQLHHRLSHVSCPHAAHTGPITGVSRLTRTRELGTVGRDSLAQGAPVPRLEGQLKSKPRSGGWSPWAFTPPPSTRPAPCSGRPSEQS